MERVYSKEEQDEAYQWLLKHSDFVRNQEAKYKKWQKRAKKHLMTNLIPRIYKLGTQFYAGAGFHYDLEISAGKQLVGLSESFQWTSGNWANETKNWAQFRVSSNMLVLKMLTEEVKKAELSAKMIKKLGLSTPEYENWHKGQKIIEKRKEVLHKRRVDRKIIKEIARKKSET